MVPVRLLEMHDDVVVEPALRAGGLVGRQGRLRLQTQDGIGVFLALGLGEVTPEKTVSEGSSLEDGGVLTTPYA